MAPPLVDAHHLGSGGTGNETWTAGVISGLEADGGPPMTYAVTHPGRSLMSGSVSGDRLMSVSRSSVRRLAVDLPRVIRRTHPAAILTHYSLPPVSVPGAVVVHDLSFEEPQAEQWLGRTTALRCRLTVRQSVRRARVVLVPTRWTKDAIVDRYGLDPETVFIAPNAVAPDLAPLLRRPPDRPADGCTVLCVGTVVPRKNLDVVGQAVTLLRRRGARVRLRLVGPLRPTGGAVLDRMRDVLPPEALEVSGMLSATGLAEAYASSSVLAFPSRLEGFGIPVIEGMAAGLPVVCSDASCLPEVSGGAATLVDPDDVDGWADAIELALTPGPERDRQIRLGRARAATYSWADTAAVVRAALRCAVQ